MKSEPTYFEGNLFIERGNVILETEEKNYFPLHSSLQTALSIDRMKMEAVDAFKEYVGRRINMAGFPQEDLIFDARVVRAYTPRDANEGHGEEYWNNRIQKAYILWNARKLPSFDTLLAVDVRQMITVNDSVISRDLARAQLLVADLKKCNEDIYKIYHHSRVKEINPYKYEYDNKIFGSEFFMYPYELRQLRKGDCDDWALELASYLISAGVPEWRVRCVAGQTFSGEGHLTVYVLADDLATWYHLNSTTAWESVEEKGYNKLTDFPKSDNQEDTIGIKDVWFSFNNKYAWHAFETHASEDNAKNVSWVKKFKIIPIF